VAPKANLPSEFPDSLKGREHGTRSLWWLITRSQRRLQQPDLHLIAIRLAECGLGLRQRIKRSEIGGMNG
jgi:hypothetical protein